MAPIPSGVSSLTETVRVAPTDSSAAPAEAATLVRKAARSEWATTTPISGQLWTTTPPALRTALESTWTWPGLLALAVLRM